MKATHAIDKTRSDKSKQGNPTVTDVPADLLAKDAKRVSAAGKGDTVTGKGNRPASSHGTSDVAPIVKQNQDTDKPAISIVPPVYGHEGIKSLDQKDDWKQAEAKAEARYGLDFLNTKTKQQRQDLVDAEYLRLHNGSFDEDRMTNHHSDQVLE